MSPRLNWRGSGVLAVLGVYAKQAQVVRAAVRQDGHALQDAQF